MRASPIHRMKSIISSEFQPMPESVPVQVAWTPATLRALLDKELPGAEVIVVSNREPYIHNFKGERINVQTPASGVVTALEPVMRACRGTWIAHGHGSADRHTVDEHDRLRVPPRAPTYTLRRVWLTEEEQDGYYYGFANEGLWPLCHVAFVRPTFRESDWASYVRVNQRFADAIVEEAVTDSPVVLIQDYHFALLPRMVREKLPKATLVTFWHIPWPNPEAFGVCPWREEIIDGLLGSTILGFHTRFHCNNFLDGVDRFIESRIDRETSSVVLGGEETLVRSYPISIEWPPAQLIDQAPIAVCRSRVRAGLGLADDIHLGVGVERLDYTKGIPDRLRAINTFFDQHPEWVGRFAFVQAAAPSRSKLPDYDRLQAEVVALAESINARHGREGYQPVHLQLRHHEPDEVFELLRAADVCVVSSLHDGMNLVAKEFVAAREDEHGVLILSSFAGASRDLPEALIINPFDEQGTSDTLHRALLIPEEEQRERMHIMRDQVRDRNVYRWVGQMLLDAARVRSHQRIGDISEQNAEDNQPRYRS